MKESITKFDLEAAFKALDEIDVPAAGKVKANRPALTEIFSRKSKFDSLMEEYYDIGSTEELGEAQEAREAEVAKAKLARIEKIVDLDADSPEDLLTSYVGKYIMQCPQCMTLFYKDQEDIVKDEEDPDTVNVNEVCQHCGNETGYTLIGKVGEAEQGEFSEQEAELDMPVEGTEEEIPEETEETPEEGAEDLGDLDALDLDLDLEDEEKTEESFTQHTGETLVEELADDADLDAKLEAHNEYIEYLRAAIAQEEEKLEKATNEQVKVAIQRNIDAFKADLESALPDAVKNDIALPEEPVDEEPVEAEPEAQEESCDTVLEGESLTEALHEETELEVSAEEFEELIKSPEFKKPISDEEARTMIADETEAEDEPLTEGGLGTLAKAVGKKIATGSKNLKNKVSTAIDKFADSAKTREEKANWILANALEDYSNAEFSNDGNVDTNGAAKRFKTFIVIGYTNKYTNDKEITSEPSSEKDLVPGMTVPQEKTDYKDAEEIAKGWSMRQGNGPAYIYLAKSADDDKAVYLCSYFQGKLGSNDKLEELFTAVANDIAGNAAMERGGMDQSETTKMKASELKPGMKLQLKIKDTQYTADVVDIKAESDLGDGYTLTVKIDNGGTAVEKTYDIGAERQFAVFKKSVKAESFEQPAGLSMIMEGVDELQESALETLISSSLVEAYGNVAGFKLAECAYANNKLTVDGTIYFTSGNTRKTTYTFTESVVSTKGKVSLHGLNEKLGLDKQFVLTGRIDNKTLITESFKYNK